MGRGHLLVAGGVLIVLAVGLLWFGRPGLPTRYTASDLTSVSSVLLGDEVVWVRQTSHREIWIRPDGSGRILEQQIHTDPLDPSQAAVWATAARDAQATHDRLFEVGGLSYLRPSDVKRGLDVVRANLSGGDGLREVASLLAETAPSESVVGEAFSISKNLDGVEETVEENLVTFTGLAAFGGGTQVEIVFDGSGHRFVRERWYALTKVAGFPLPPPAIMFDRLVIRSTEVADVSASPMMPP